MAAIETAGAITPNAAAEAPASRRSRILAIALMCGAMVCFAGLDTSAKYLGRLLPTIEVVWARYVVASVFTLIVTRAFARPRILRASRPGLQLLRSSLLLGSTLANFLALRHLQLAETSTIAFLQPMFVALLAGPLLGEKVGGPRLIAILVGFAGVVIATRPGTSAFQPIVFVAVAGVACAGGYALATRRLAAHDRRKRRWSGPRSPGSSCSRQCCPGSGPRRRRRSPGP